MQDHRRQDDRLYWWKVLAGVLSATFLAGLLLTAIFREFSSTYIPLVSAALAAVLIGVTVSLVRRYRAWLHPSPCPGGPLEDRLTSVVRKVGLIGIGTLLLRRKSRKDRS
ncbi:hypothetical protein [Lentzea sp. NEAU-D7]|uniref:hypothetical protein n=1 Tax=Lentzea sp. NEAU-D7 TaxID=2994667 RepID=UPI00224A61FF|nr:hypothetical protein [Lentzea sp. NEAU-D7]MCX2948854.1 hypothetical protein [Lentzea sp. NEAU-D7]